MGGKTPDQERRPGKAIASVSGPVTTVLTAARSLAARELARLSPLSFPLLPFYLSFRIGWWSRYLLARGRRKKAGRLRGKVISIGNIEWGGTGKTMLTRELAEYLASRGRKVAVLSRGYGRKTSGVFRVDPAEADAAARYGDEPVWIARQLPGVSVWVGEDRWLAGIEAERRAHPDVYVLDDGLQILSIEKDMEVVMLDPAAFRGGPVWLSQIFFRAPLRVAQWANIAIQLDPSMAAGASARPLPMSLRCPSLRARYRVEGFRDLASGACLSAESLGSLPVAVFCGIAKPERFASTLEALGLKVAVRRFFPDHHAYREVDMARLLRWARACGARALVTTAKDAVRLPAIAGADGLPIYSAEARFEWPDGRGHLEEMIESLWAF